jgi:predicted DNA-binding protein
MISRYNNTQRLNITLSNPIVEELNTFVVELGAKKSHLIEEALTYYFDMLDEKLASKRLKELEDGKVKTIPASEVWAELGL